MRRQLAHQRLARRAWRCRTSPSACCGWCRGSRPPRAVSWPSRVLAGRAGPSRACRRRCPGRSILITSAPRSASVCVHQGPASTRERSSTRMPASDAVRSRLRRSCGRLCAASRSRDNHPRCFDRLLQPCCIATALAACTPDFRLARGAARGQRPRGHASLQARRGCAQRADGRPRGEPGGDRLRCRRRDLCGDLRRPRRSRPRVAPVLAELRRSGAVEHRRSAAQRDRCRSAGMTPNVAGQSLSACRTPRRTAATVREPGCAASPRGAMSSRRVIGGGAAQARGRRAVLRGARVRNASRVLAAAQPSRSSWPLPSPTSSRRCCGRSRPRSLHLQRRVRARRAATWACWPAPTSSASRRSSLPLGRALDRFGPERVILGFSGHRRARLRGVRAGHSFAGLIARARAHRCRRVGACLMAPLTGFRRCFTPAAPSCAPIPGC